MLQLNPVYLHFNNLLVTIMTGGILQLVTYGIEDIFIIGKPQITFFKTVYRRHTNFSRDEVDLFFNNKVDFGRESRCKIKRFGDLLHRLFIVITVPEIDVRFRTLTIGEVKKILAECDVIWTTNRPNDQVFSQEAFDEVVVIIDNKIVDIKIEIDITEEILVLLREDGDFFPSVWLDDNPEIKAGLENGSISNKFADDVYFNDFINAIIDKDTFNDLGIIYKFIDAHDRDRTPPLALDNSTELQIVLFNEFVEFATGANEFDPTSFNDENLLFLFNTETANYNIGGGVSQLDSNTVFRTGIINAYGGERFDNLDGFKIFENILDRQQADINSNFDVQIIRDILLENIRFGLIKNPKLLVNVYNSLNSDFKFIFYKKLERQAPGIYKANNEFVNLSLTTAGDQENEFNDNFTNDFAIIPEPGESDNVIHPYNEAVSSSVNSFHESNRDYFGQSRFIDYFNDNIIWQRTDIGEPQIDPTVDSGVGPRNNLCFDIINTLFGNVPSTLFKMYFMNYIPLLTAYDVPEAINRHIANVLSNPNSSAPKSLIGSFLPALNAQLNALRNNLLNLLESVICIENDFLTARKLSGFRDRIGPDGDILIFTVFRFGAFLDFFGQQLHYPQYVIESYLKELEDFSAPGYEDTIPNEDPDNDTIKKQLINVVNLFATPSSEIPTHITYLSLNRNLSTRFLINNNNDYILSDFVSSMWYHSLQQMVDAYNSLYDTKILGVDNFEATVGAEMSKYLEEIRDQFFNTPPLGIDLPTPIDYFFDTDRADLPEEDGGIGTFLLGKISNFNDQLSKYDANRKLLDMRSLIISKPLFFFEVWRTVLNEFVDVRIERDRDVNGDLVYDHEDHDITGVDPVLLIKDTLINSANPDFDPDIPMNNAMDIFKLTNNDFDELVEKRSNPFTVPDQQNKFDLWESIWLPTKSFNTRAEQNKYDTLFGNISSIELYKLITTIDVVYNQFQFESNIYRFMKDITVRNSIFQPLLNLKSNVIATTHARLLDYHEDLLIDLENQLVKLEGDSSTQSLTDRLENTLNGGLPANFAWVKKLGHYILEHVRIVIGGQEIDRHTGEWLEVWHELTKKDSKERGYKILIGDVSELTEFNKNIKGEYEIILPLKFWFCRNTGASLPLISMQHTFVEIFAKFRKFNELSFADDFIEFRRRPRLKAKLLAEYIYIEEEERIRFAKTKMEYLLDTLQINGDIILTKDTLDEENSKSMHIYFQNPVKEFIWVIQRLDFVDGSRPNGERKWNNYGFDFDSAKQNPIESIKIKFSSRDREQFHDVELFNYVYPYERHYHTPSDGVHVYSFSLRPELNQPNGSANLSRIDDASIIVKLRSDVVEQMKRLDIRFRCAIYGTSFNILRVMSGFAGLAYFR